MPSLPNEVLGHIFSFLDVDSPSPLEKTHLYNEPFNMVKAILVPRKLDNLRDDFYPNHPIKAASMVCTSWRAAILRILYRHVIWCTACIKQPVEENTNTSHLPFIEFLLRNDLARSVKSVSILLHYSQTSRHSLDLGDETGVLRPGTSGHGELFYPGVQQFESEDQRVPSQLWDNNWLWESIFQHLDPLRFTLISSPALLLSLFSRDIVIPRRKVVFPPYDIVSFSREPEQTFGLSRPFLDPNTPEAIPCTLFTIRPWEHLLINEGSTVDIWRTAFPEDYFVPSLLPVLLNSSDACIKPLLPNLASLSYISVHPHHSISRHLILKLPPVKSLYLQFAPKDGPEADEESLRPSRISQDSMGAAMITGTICLPSTIRSDRALACIQLCPRAIGARGNPRTRAWAGLQHLVCREVLDEEAWQTVEPFHERFREAGRLKLRHVGDGVFLRVDGTL
ncbi:hypothetical protein NM208_g2270 [Fusarium decemcellulare]|uniref:Uncharacterized protein n=1 Tax=Fusarium decemcellulare TaxID=57161 RepID=A0ACC1ST72_9HYPO|nr:hypothetical protein NM208_g2270 [Fusarium decemcellulare]